MLAPVLERVTTLATDINFAKVDIDQLSAIAAEFNIHSVPTVFLFQNGKPISHFVGFKNEPQVLEFINENKK
jgi:thioredoxin-like negative regulator of GroEL